MLPRFAVAVRSWHSKIEYLEDSIATGTDDEAVMAERMNAIHGIIIRYIDVKHFVGLVRA